MVGGWGRGGRRIHQIAHQIIEFGWTEPVAIVGRHHRLTGMLDVLQVRLLKKVEGGEITAASGKKVFEKMFETGKDAAEIVAAEGLAQELPSREDLTDATVLMTPPGFDTTNAPGMVAPGNLDPWNRPVLHNPDGGYSTTSSISIGTLAFAITSNLNRCFGSL